MSKANFLDEKLNFDGYMRCCSTNYAYLHKLLKHLNLNEAMQCLPLSASHSIEVNQLSHSKYTEELKFFQQTHTQNHFSWLTNFVIQLRLYHDANLAEVLSFQDGTNRIYNFSGSSARQSISNLTDKWQSTLLLNEVLLVCMSRIGSS